MPQPLSRELRDLLAKLEGRTPGEQKELLSQQSFDAIRYLGVLPNNVSALNHQLRDDPSFPLPGRTREESKDILDAVERRQNRWAADEFRARDSKRLKFVLGFVAVAGVIVLMWAYPNWLDVFTHGIASLFRLF